VRGPVPGRDDRAPDRRQQFRQPVAGGVTEGPPRTQRQAVGVGLDRGDHRQSLGAQPAVVLQPAPLGQPAGRVVPLGVLPPAGAHEPLPSAAAGRRGEDMRGDAVDLALEQRGDVPVPAVFPQRGE
jgi:hypothetical protein